MEEGIKEEEGLEDSANEEEEETQEDWSDHFVEFKKKRATRKKIMKKISSGHRLYAIDRRRGESITTGLYLETWNKLELIVSGYSKNRYKKFIISLCNERRLQHLPLVALHLRPSPPFFDAARSPSST